MLRKLVNRALGPLGYEVKKIKRKPVRMPAELTPEECAIVDYVKLRNLSMVSYQRLFATAMACKYVIDRNIEGDFVECGVWRGGNAIVAAAIFDLYQVKRKVWLFDTFKGMTSPTEVDANLSDGRSATAQYLENQRSDHNDWAYASLDDVKENFRGKNLLSDNIIFVQGDVGTTLDNEANIPIQISVLRLDTDWYESTKKELEVLYPRIPFGGCIIMDDYGAWSGAKKATDEYFEGGNNRPFLHYIDNSGRIAVKLF